MLSSSCAGLVMMDSIAPEWTVRDLKQHLDSGERLFILDVRNRDEFERSRIEGRIPIQTTHVPYFEMLETAADDEDLEAAVARYLQATLATTLPRDTPLLTVCAKGARRVVACDMSQSVMGIKDSELRADIDHGGVGTFLGSALRSRVAMFI